MCGRFVQNRDPLRYAEFFGLDTGDSRLPDPMARFNGAPGQELLVIRHNGATGLDDLSRLLWGLVPSWAEDPKGGAKLINARSETVVERAAFRAAWRKRRCVVPADAFYEWRRGGSARQPFVVARRDGAPMALAGLWEGWRNPQTGLWLRTFTILTCPANAALAPLHERMPVILPCGAVHRYLRAENPADLLVPCPAEELEARPVSTRVNSPRSEGPDLIAPLEPDPLRLNGPER